MDYSLYYQGKELSLVGYSNANWVGNPDESKSTFGYTFLLNNGVISWRSKKQTCTTLLTMEVKFITYLVVVQKTCTITQLDLSKQEIDSLLDNQYPINKIY